VILVLALALAPQNPQLLCGVCHSETVKEFLTHAHSQNELSCDVCHGASVRHRASQGNAEPDRVAAPHEIPALCAACHPGKESVPIQAQYAASKHGKLVLEQSKVRAAHCGTCHGVHSRRQGKAMETQCRRCHASLPSSCSNKPVRAAPVACAGCHSPHTLAAVAAAR